MAAPACLQPSAVREKFMRKTETVKQKHIHELQNYSGRRKRSHKELHNKMKPWKQSSDLKTAAGRLRNQTQANQIPFSEIENSSSSNQHCLGVVCLVTTWSALHVPDDFATYKTLRTSATEWNKAPGKKKIAKTNYSNRDLPRKWRGLEPDCDDWRPMAIEDLRSQESEWERGKGSPDDSMGHPAHVTPVFIDQPPTNSLGEGFCFSMQVQVKWLCLCVGKCVMKRGN